MQYTYILYKLGKHFVLIFESSRGGYVVPQWLFFS